MFLILIKILLSIFIVLGLVWISERSPKWGGLLAGLPLGTGILIMFYGLEQGIPFVMDGIPYGMAGLVSMQAFGIGFYWGGKFLKQNRICQSFSAFLDRILFPSKAASWYADPFVRTIK